MTETHIPNSPGAQTLLGETDINRSCRMGVQCQGGLKGQKVEADSPCWRGFLGNETPGPSPQRQVGAHQTKRLERLLPFMRSKRGTM